MKPLMIVLAALAFGSSLLAQRQVIDLGSDWKFIRQDMGPTAEPDGAWSDITVPHTWNVSDGQNGKAAEPKLPDGYYRGSGWYYRRLTLPAELGDRRVIVRCEAVNQVADLYVNEHHVGQHRGGYTAFAFDVTPFLRRDGRDVLRIRADNSRFPDLAPLNGDFTFFGGAYRPVTLLVVHPVHLTLLDHGTRGVSVRQQQLSTERAEIGVRSLVRSEAVAETNVLLKTVIVDADGQRVSEQVAVVVLATGETRAVEQVLQINRPHRWHGRRDPYLYRVRVEVQREGRTVDTVEEPLGLRTVAIDEARGFLLNDEPYPIRGVSRHQDRLDRGTALSVEEQTEDIRLVLEMGATAIRLAHYPQSDVIHQLADQHGLLLWEEIPNIERVPSLPEFAPRLKQQLVEMILQGYNHPSVAFWGLFNEAKATWQTPMGAPPEPLTRELRALAQQLDPSRLIVGASWLRHRDPLHDEVTYPAFNQYPGWKFDTPADMGRWIDVISSNHGGRRIAIAEYGAGASVHHHLEKDLAPPVSTETPFHPEEWQAIVHEGNWRDMRANPRLWGSFVWVMFDFAADYRNEGDTPGRNDKGLVTYDRKTRKDAYHFYQANWTEKPMVYVTSRRMERRRLSPVPEVKVYSNCAEVELRVNGASLGLQKPDEIAVCRWADVALQRGANRIEAIARTADGVETRDACSWYFEPTP